MPHLPHWAPEHAFPPFPRARSRALGPRGPFYGPGPKLRIYLCGGMRGFLSPLLKMGHCLFRSVFSGPLLTQPSRESRVSFAERVPSSSKPFSGSLSGSLSSAEEPLLEDGFMMSRPFCLFHILRCLPQSELKQPTAGAHISLVVPLHPDPHALWCEGSVRATGESSPVEITMDVLKS